MVLTQRRMRHLQYRKCLRPFHEVADAPVHVLEADEGHEQQHAAEDGDPKRGADDVVDEQILGLRLPWGRRGPVHDWMAWVTPFDGTGRSLPGLELQQAA